MSVHSVNEGDEFTAVGRPDQSGSPPIHQRASWTRSYQYIGSTAVVQQHAYRSTGSKSWIIAQMWSKIPDTANDVTAGKKRIVHDDGRH